MEDQLAKAISELTENIHALQAAITQYQRGFGDTERLLTQILHEACVTGSPEELKRLGVAVERESASLSERYAVLCRRIDAVLERLNDAPADALKSAQLTLFTEFLDELRQCPLKNGKPENSTNDILEAFSSEYRVAYLSKAAKELVARASNFATLEEEVSEARHLLAQEATLDFPDYSSRLEEAHQKLSRALLRETSVLEQHCSAVTRWVQGISHLSPVMKTLSIELTLPDAILPSTQAEFFQRIVEWFKAIVNGEQEDLPPAWIVDVIESLRPLSKALSEPSDGIVVPIVETLEEKWPFRLPIQSTPELILEIWERDAECVTALFQRKPGLGWLIIKKTTDEEKPSIDENLLGDAFKKVAGYLRENGAPFIALCLWDYVRQKSSSVYEDGLPILANTILSQLRSSQDGDSESLANVAILLRYLERTDEFELSHDRQALNFIVAVLAGLSASEIAFSKSSMTAKLPWLHSALPEEISSTLREFDGAPQNVKLRLLEADAHSRMDEATMLQPHNYGTARILYDLEEDVLKKIQMWKSEIESSPDSPHIEDIVDEIDRYDFRRILDTNSRRAKKKNRQLKSNVRKSYIDRTSRRIVAVREYALAVKDKNDARLGKAILANLSPEMIEAARSLWTKVAETPSGQDLAGSSSDRHWYDVPYPLKLPGAGICPELAGKLECRVNGGGEIGLLEPGLVVFNTSPLISSAQANEAKETYRNTHDYAMAALVSNHFSLERVDSAEEFAAIANATERLSSTTDSIGEGETQCHESGLLTMSDVCTTARAHLAQAKSFLERRRLPGFEEAIAQAVSARNEISESLETNRVSVLERIDTADSTIRTKIGSDLLELGDDQIAFSKEILSRLDVLRTTPRFNENYLSELILITEKLFQGEPIGPLKAQIAGNLADSITESSEVREKTTNEKIAAEIEQLVVQYSGDDASGWLADFLDIVRQGAEGSVGFLVDKASKEESIGSILWYGIPCLKKLNVPDNEIDTIVAELRSHHKYSSPDVLLYDAGLSPEETRRMNIEPGGRGRARLLNAFNYPDVGDYVSELGQNLIDGGHRRTTVKLFRAMVDIFPDVPKIRVQLGYAAENDGDFETAWRSWASACEMNPWAPSFRILARKCAGHGESAMSAYYWHRFILLAKNPLERQISNSDILQAEYNLKSASARARIPNWQTRAEAYKAKYQFEKEKPELLSSLDRLVAVMITEPTYWVAHRFLLELLESDAASITFDSHSLGTHILDFLKSSTSDPDGAVLDFTYGTILESRDDYESALKAYGRSQRAGFVAKAAEAIQSLEARRLDELQPGAIFCKGRFVVVERMPGAHGSFGLVIHAQDRKHDNRDCAVKMLQSSLRFAKDTVRAKGRFDKEGNLAIRLQHPNIVESYDFIDNPSEGERQYMVMEYLEGQTLEQLIKREGAIHWQRASTIVRQIALGLRYASSYEGVQLVHRDIAPRNLMLLADDKVKILDFGHALIGSAAQSSSASLNLRSIYKAPETRYSERLSAQVDIFALGIVYYELLTGEMPYNEMEWTSQQDTALMDDSSGDGTRRIQPVFQDWPGELDESLPTEIRTLVQEMIEYDFKVRASDYLAVIDTIDRNLKQD